MILTRDKGQRMWGGSGGSSYSYGGGGGGGESPVVDGFVTNDYYNQNFELLYKQEATTSGTTTTTFLTAPPNTIVPVGTVTDSGTTTVTSLVGPVAKNAIVLGNIMMVYDSTNNAIKVVNRDGTTAANFYATGGVSALGYNPGGGGGGGADLNLLLDNINSSNIGNTAPTGNEVGKCLVYNGNNQWAWATPGSGSGGIENVSVASAGLLTGGSVSGSTLTLTTRAIQTGDIPDLSGTYLPLTGGTLTGALTLAGVNIYMGTSGSSSNATGDIVFKYGNGNEKGRIWMDTTFSSETGAKGPQYRCYDTSGAQLVSTRLVMATEISGMATQSWVNSQGFTTNTGTVTQVKMTVPTGFSVSPSSITTSGTFAVTFASGYSLPTTTKQSNWDTAYTKINNGTWWGRTMNSSGVVSGDIDMATGDKISFGNSNTLQVDSYSIALGYGFRSSLPLGLYGSSINFYPGGSLCANISSSGLTVGTSATDETHYIQIGGARLYWEDGSHSLKVVGSDGTSAVNFYSLGAVSALGMSSGTGGLSELTVNTLKGVRYLQNASGAVSITSGSSYIYLGAGSGSNVYVADSSNTYFDTNGHLHLTGKRLYLDSTRYVYVSNSHLYFYNGSSSIQIA